MEKYKKHVIIPIFIPHRGCPFDCIFCNQKAISGQVEEMTVEKMQETIEEHLKTINSISNIQIAFYGGSFTGIPIEEQTKFLSCAWDYISSGKVQGIKLSTRPDYITEEILDNLIRFDTKEIELGVQSLDDEVLKVSCRGHSSSDVYTASKLIKGKGIKLGIQTMIGLPSDSRDKALDTARKVVEISPDIVRIYPALVIRGTFMERMYKNGNYFPLSLEEAVDLSAELMDIYEKANINVIRVGLQATDSINSNMDVVAGPFHPAFRELAESKRNLKRIVKEIENSEEFLKHILSETLEIQVAKGLISQVVGNKRANINTLKSNFGFKHIKITEQADINKLDKFKLIL